MFRSGHYTTYCEKFERKNPNTQNIIMWHWTEKKSSSSPFCFDHRRMRSFRSIKMKSRQAQSTLSPPNEMSSLSLNDFLNKYSSRGKPINWSQVSSLIHSKPRQVNKLTLFHAVMVGAKNEFDQLDFPGSDDSNPIPLSIVKDVLRLGHIEVSQYHTVLLYALLNNSVTTEVFKCIVDANRKLCPEADLLSKAWQSYSLQSQQRWSQCKTNPRRKLWILWWLNRNRWSVILPKMTLDQEMVDKCWIRQVQRFLLFLLTPLWSWALLVTLNIMVQVQHSTHALILNRIIQVGLLIWPEERQKIVLIYYYSMHGTPLQEFWHFIPFEPIFLETKNSIE